MTVMQIPIGGLVIPVNAMKNEIDHEEKIDQKKIMKDMSVIYDALEEEFDWRLNEPFKEEVKFYAIENPQLALQTQRENSKLFTNGISFFEEQLKAGSTYFDYEQVRMGKYLSKLKQLQSINKNEGVFILANTIVDEFFRNFSQE